MKAPLPPSKKTPSYRLHRRQFIGQILVPVLIAIALIVAAAVFAAIGGGDQASLWADISVIWLLIPMFFFALVFLVILLASIYALATLLKVTPTYTHKTQVLTRRVARKIRQGADAAVRPIFFVEGVAASLRALLGRK